MAFFAIPVLIAVIVGCIIRTRNMRKLRHFNAFLSDVKNTGGTGSVLGDWMNRRKGFQRLDQYSDGENEPLDTENNNDNSDIERDETSTAATAATTTTATTKQDTTTDMPHNNNNNITFKMGASL